MGVGNMTGSEAHSTPAGDVLRVGTDARGAFVAAFGSIRAALCYPLRETLLARLEETADIPAVFVDLSRCEYMDSTFIGLLVAMDRRLRKGSGGRVHVIRPSTPCRELLRQMGLQELLLVEEAAVELPASMEEVEKPSGRPATEFVLRAHEALMETSEEARRKFALLREELERKLRAEKPPEGSP
jgi:anti-anti-sigma factor